MADKDFILNLPIPSSIIWLLFIAIVGIFLIISAIFEYHWNYHGVKENKKVYARPLYYVVSGLILFLMLVTALIYTFLP